MGASELMIILVIILLLFGASKLPELGRSLGSGLSNFKKGLKDGDEVSGSVRLPESDKATARAEALVERPPAVKQDS